MYHEIRSVKGQPRPVVVAADRRTARPRSGGDPSGRAMSCVYDAADRRARGRGRGTAAFVANSLALAGLVVLAVVQLGTSPAADLATVGGGGLEMGSFAGEEAATAAERAGVAASADVRATLLADDGMTWQTGPRSRT